jgi:tetratricopeptide (TPR) repeat protein
VPNSEYSLAGPTGSPYDWYQRAQDLLASGNSDAAAQLLERLLEAEPGSRSVLEAYARAVFDARRYGDAVSAFGALLEVAPDDDYAHFGMGMSLWRQQEFVLARDHLSMAFVMRPDRTEYGKALSQVKATLRARAADQLPLNGPLIGSPVIDVYEVDES